MKIFTILLFLLSCSSALSFMITSVRHTNDKYTIPITATSTSYDSKHFAYKEIYSSIPSSSNNKYPDEDPVSKIDLGRAHECADHFGKCSMKEMENMKTALHTEKIQTTLLGNVLTPDELIDHRLLEEDLSHQLSLLQEQQYQVQQQIHQDPINDETSKHEHHLVADVQHLIQDSEEKMLLIPSGLVETIIIIIVLSLLVFVPHL